LYVMTGVLNIMMLHGVTPAAQPVGRLPSGKMLMRCSVVTWLYCSATPLRLGSSMRTPPRAAGGVAIDVARPHG